MLSLCFNASSHDIALFHKIENAAMSIRRRNFGTRANAYYAAEALDRVIPIRLHVFTCFRVGGVGGALLQHIHCSLITRGSLITSVLALVYSKEPSSVMSCTLLVP